LTFGVTGTTRIDQIAIKMSGRAAGQDVISYLALGMLLVGFAFKASAAPFRAWTPDVYDGAPAVVTVFMSAGVKAASFAACARVLMSAFGGTSCSGGPPSGCCPPPP
jgi:NADH-quinone oxidoreductase subunit N